MDSRAIFPFILFMISMSFSSSAATLTVCKAGCGYSSIQGAVDSASAGDMVLVKDGSYDENVFIRKSLDVRSENGAQVTFVRAKDPYQSVFGINAENVSLHGFTVSGATKYYEYDMPLMNAGIYLYGAKGCHVTENVAEGNGFGIMLAGSDHNIVEGNYVTLNDPNGSSFSPGGISLSESNSNIILNNSVQSNKGYGIAIWECQNNTISSNYIKSNSFLGINIDYYSKYNVVVSNTIAFNGIGGISLGGVDSINENVISSNDISNNSFGIMISGFNNSILNNRLRNNGLTVMSIYPNRVENNTVNGKPLVYLEDKTNQTIHYAGQVLLMRCNNMTLENMDLSNTDYGLELYQSYFNEIRNCTFSNDLRGLFLYLSPANYIHHNLVSHNSEGVYVELSPNNILHRNGILSNKGNGVYFYGSAGGIIVNNNLSLNGVGLQLIGSRNANIYNNFFNNLINSMSNNSINFWNTSKHAVASNIMRGNYSGGNYWSDYCGFDRDGDGIGDSPYALDNGNTDYLPLVSPDSYPERVYSSPQMRFSIRVIDYLKQRDDGNAGISDWIILMNAWEDLINKCRFSIQ